MPEAEPTVLLVDDDDDARGSVADALEQSGYAVRAAATGEDALRSLAAEPAPCVIVLDLLMPEMDGAELLARLRAEPRLAAIPVIVATGIATSKVRSLLGADAYLFKPFAMAELRLEIDRLCRTGRPAAG